MPYWIRFEKPIKLGDREVTSACIHASQDPNLRTWEQLEAEAKERASKFGPVKEILPLPYGARPSLDGERMGDFCHDPEKCAGRTSCPKSYACSE